MYSAKRLPTQLLVASILILLLAACRSSGAALQMGDGTTPLTGPAFIVCSDTCFAQGQCGVANPPGVEPYQAVLLNAAAPATKSHSLLTPANSAVTILSSQTETMQRADTGESFSLTFYNVALTERQNARVWVPGWCVANKRLE